MTEEIIEVIETRWSLIQHAHSSGQPESASDARRLLVLRYSPAIRRYVGGIVRNDDLADELSQELLLRLMRGDFGGANPSFGRFRDFLKMAIRNLARTAWQKSQRRKTVDVELDLIGSDAGDSADREWTDQWRKSVLDHAWNRFLMDQGGKSTAGYQALKLKMEFPDADSDELAERLSHQTGTAIRADNFRQILKRARTRFAAHLFDEVRAGLESESIASLEEELSALGLLDFVRHDLPASQGE
ncbi:RNA polymerase sigma factor [Schlesneria paludicola]|uniref:RNA polymerase sigma factor n=1 Tax=Schlesneria paludicola TaxID=360056 RepID=UPI000299F41C|nr:sigma-70 family RNA polymerase sigma factor [Schlesneria paludicola]